ncbi:IclR family transcriptional regulator [Nonlabens arenilitoris]|uniref:IclR family transcriptional regulator n=1 Tax=Nonlabens arenilitoris TaxID=1217969 RepID=A0A2S7UE97_9FLAO|nr:uracil-DNA glycosylase family protein [Nonlabens arenilitoris]PQJ32542.1 IclR family transcriptional regulator [Nonlabens arenilitoris]
MKELIKTISQCTVCKEHLSLGPRPIVTAHKKSKIVIIGQAPGTVVHKTGIPWNDKSGENLRQWLNISREDFYDVEKFAIIPMGFCYPGKGKTGDLPPRKECAPLWHNQLLSHLTEVELILLIGKYAQDYYLKESSRKTLTETVKNYQEYLPKYFVLPHPSPRNNIWQAKNEWFKRLVLPELKNEIKCILG